jgi:hypothetical protein
MSSTSLLALALPWLSASSVLAWLSAASVLALGAVAVAGALNARPAAPIRRRLRLVGTVLVGALAVAGSAWQAITIGAARAPQPVVARHDQPSRPPTQDLRERIKSLESQIDLLRHSTTMRSITPDTANKLSEYLKQFGSHRVVVSCAPNDVEAYNYATQLTNVLKAAKWDASGPEVTTIFGDVRAMAINVYGDAAPGGGGALEILVAALAKFNIPYQQRVAPSRVPADAAIELFVGAQPVRRAATTTAGAQ